MGAVRPFSGSIRNFGKPPHPVIRWQSDERPEPTQAGHKPAYYAISGADVQRRWAPAGLRPRRSFQATAPSRECKRSATVGAVKVSGASPGLRHPLTRVPRRLSFVGSERHQVLGSLMRGLPEFHLAAAIRRLSNGVDQTMQVDCGLEGRLTTFPVTDCLSE